MKRFQYFRLEKDEAANVPVCLERRNKMQTAVLLDSPERFYFNLRLDETGSTIKLHYTKFELADAEGNPVYEPVIDMTGREIGIDSWVCFSQGTSYSHSLCIGKVVKVTPVGALVVRVAMTDGRKTRPNAWRGGDTNVNDPDRCIKLPVDPSTMMMWLFKDFEDLKEKDA